MNSNNNGTTRSGGIGFCGLLTIVFITLKLVGVIKWSWLWVLAPLWMPWMPSVITIVIFVLSALIEDDEDDCNEED